MNEKLELDQVVEKLREHEQRIAQLEKSIAETGALLPTTAINQQQIPLGTELRRLADRIGSTEERIKSLFDIDAGSLTIIRLPEISDLEERSQQSVLAVLIGYKYIMGKEEVPATELRRNLAEHGISLANFATYLNAIVPTLVRRKGKTKSPKTTYKLTVFGESRAREVLGRLKSEVAS